jgi:ABC-type Fe3+ transport system permease subunit
MTDEQIGGLTMWIPGCMMFATSIILILHRWGVDEERTAERRRQMGTAEAYAATRAMSLRQSNRALAVGLVSFVALVLFVALTSAVLYDHERHTRSLTAASVGHEGFRKSVVNALAADR